MTDGAIRRSRRSRRPPRILEEDYASTMAAESEAEEEHPTVQEMSERPDDVSDSQSLHRKKRRKTSRRTTISWPGAHEWDPVNQQSEDGQPTNEQQAIEPSDVEAQALDTSPGPSNGREGHTQAKNSRLGTAAPKHKKQKYDPEPMKAVAEHAQDILAPVSQTNVPAAADSCVVLNCRSSVPVSQKAFKEKTRKVLAELQHHLQAEEVCSKLSLHAKDDGADIDVTALLLPEPGLPADAALLSLPAPSAAPAAPPHLHPEPGRSADPATQSLRAPSSTLAAAAGADEADEGFQEELAEAGKSLQSLENRLKGRRTTMRLYYRAPEAGQPEAGAIVLAGEDRLSSDDIIITVGALRYGQTSCLQEYNVLQRQPLTVLRDLLSCPADSYLGALGMAVPGAYFYIEGTFYNDMRQPGCVDYSEQILQFCREQSLMPPKAPLHPSCEASWRAPGFSQPGGRAEQTAGAYKKASMQETSFGDVDNLRIGATGYVYCHQGCCEHALYIKDIRRIHFDDPQQASAYPVQTFQATYRRQKCSICVARFASKITYEDKFALVTPGFWCTECYEAMHYDASGKLKDNHRVFPLPVVV